MPRSSPAKDARRAQERRAQAGCYKDVDLRDRRACRLCGAFAAGHHHHHLRYRSLGGRHTPANVLLLCARCHRDVHAARVRLSGDADARDDAGRLAGVTVERPGPDGWHVVGLV